MPSDAITTYGNTLDIFNSDHSCIRATMGKERSFQRIEWYNSHGEVDTRNPLLPAQWSPPLNTGLSIWGPTH